MKWGLVPKLNTFLQPLLGRFFFDGGESEPAYFGMLKMLCKEKNNRGKNHENHQKFNKFGKNTRKFN